MLKATKLKYTYPGGEDLHFPDINCDKEEPTLILGPSGSGKTTLLHLLAGLRTADSGSIVIGGQDISKMRKARLDKFRGKNIGIVFQDTHFVESLSVKENLQLGLYLAGKKIRNERIQYLLDEMNVGDKANKYPNSLSRGEQQRVSIAMALVNHPEVILADEPTSALDDANAMAVISLLKKEAREEEATLIVVTHDHRIRNAFHKEINL